MAIRNLLAISKVDEFSRWLEKEKGYTILAHNVMSCEVLRAEYRNNERRDVVVLYQQHKATMHVTVQDKDHKLVREFLNYVKDKNKVWERRKTELFDEMVNYISEVVNDSKEFLRVLFRLGFKFDEIGNVCEFEDDMIPVEISTYADDDDDYCRTFVVLKGWLLEQIPASIGLEKFLDEYTWDETWYIYAEAKNEDELLFEEVQK